MSMPPLIVFETKPAAPLAPPLKSPTTPSYYKPSYGFSTIPTIPDLIEVLAF